jgi:hypothetical protein
MSDVFTEEDLNTLRLRVFEKTRAEIEKSVEQALVSELRAGVHTELRRLIAGEIRAIAKPLIEAKRQAIAARLEVIVPRMVEHAAEVIEQEIVEMGRCLVESLASSLSMTQRDVGYRIARKIQARLEKALKAERGP